MASAAPIPKVPFGRHDDRISRLGFGGILVDQVPQETANDYVAEAFDRGINYFDVAPSYGEAQEKLGPALKPYRDRSFLACKTTQRERDAAIGEFYHSLETLQTDHFDLYQLHAITEKEDVERVFAPGGFMDFLVQAKEEGKVRYLGFSAHSHRAALLAMELYDFDSLLFPFNFLTWEQVGFGKEVLQKAEEKRMAKLALKAMAHRQWPEEISWDNRPWNKAWYQPIEDPKFVRYGLRFTLNLPTTAAIPPGHWELFQLALDAFESEKINTPLTEEETEEFREFLGQGEPIFDQSAVAG